MLQCYVRNRLWHLPSPEVSFRRQGYFDLLHSDKTILTDELAATAHGSLMSGRDNVFCDNTRHYVDCVEYEGPEWASETEARALTVKGFDDYGESIVLAHDCVVGVPVHVTEQAVERFLLAPFPALQHAAATDRFVMLRARCESVVRYASVEARFRPAHRLLSYPECSQNTTLLAQTLLRHLERLGLAPLE